MTSETRARTLEAFSATIDQLSAAVHYVAREWGDYGYRITGVEDMSWYVVRVSVRHSDGSRFAVLADKWGNVATALDDSDALAAQVRTMSERAAQS
jgi:hypothetical protein